MVALELYHRKVEDRAKLEREARIAVSLAGPGVVRVFDADSERGFIVMEWLAGGALRGWLRRGDVDLLLELPVVYASGRNGAASWNKPANGTLPDNDDLEPLFDAILKHVPAPTYDDAAPLQAWARNSPANWPNKDITSYWWHGTGNGLMPPPRNWRTCTAFPLR